MVEGYTKSVRFEDGMKFENQNRGALLFYFSFLALRLILSCISFCALGDNWSLRPRCPIPSIDFLAIRERFVAGILFTLPFGVY